MFGTLKYATAGRAGQRGHHVALDERTIKTCAKSMVETCNLKKGDAVIVKGGAHNQTLLEEIALECYREGASPMIIITSDRYTKKVYDEISAKTLEIVPKHYVSMVKDADAIISVEEMDDPTIVGGFPRDKLQSRQKAMIPIFDIVYHLTDGKKWLYAGWPTKAYAKSFDVPYKTMEDIVIGGISVSPKELRKTGERLASKFKDASWIHAWDTKGTDFSVKVEGRRVNIDDGMISKEDFDAGDRGANLPAGEVFIAPYENVGSGRLYCPITSDRMTDQLVTDVSLEFKDGTLLLDKLKVGKNGKAVKASFKECEELDRKKYKQVRTTNVAELGIGYNPKITKAIGYILTDEKVTGTIHLAFGSNNTYGGTSESTMHWDFVSAPGINVDVERVDGKTVPILRKGIFV